MAYFRGDISYKGETFTKHPYRDTNVVIIDLRGDILFYKVVDDMRFLFLLEFFVYQKVWSPGFYFSF